MEKYFEIGQIVNTNGLKGVVKVKPFTDNLKEFESFKIVYVEKKGELIEFAIEAVRYTRKYGISKAKRNR